MSISINHILGLDLGQTTNPSALVVLERRQAPNDWRSREQRGGITAEAGYDCRKIKRWPLGTSYTAIVRDTLEVADLPSLVDPCLVVDQTGVGRAVVDIFREVGNLQQIPVQEPDGRETLRFRLSGRSRSIRFEAVTITSGHIHSRVSNGDLHVPKKDLVAVVQRLLGYDRLRIAAGMEEADQLEKELQNFQMKITQSANDVFGAFREGTYDDIVLALAVAAWVGEQGGFGPIEPEEPYPEESMSVIARAPRGVFAHDDNRGKGPYLT